MPVSSNWAVVRAEVELGVVVGGESHVCVCVPGGGRGGELMIFLGGGVPPGPENPYPISDQNIRFSIPYFRPDSQNVYPISDPVMCGKFGNSQ